MIMLYSSKQKQSSIIKPVPSCSQFSFFSYTFSFIFDSYILEGKELEFYMKKLQKKKGKGASGAA